MCHLEIGRSVTCKAHVIIVYSVGYTGPDMHMASARVDVLEIGGKGGVRGVGAVRTLKTRADNQFKMLVGGRLRRCVRTYVRTGGPLRDRIITRTILL